MTNQVLDKAVYEGVEYLLTGIAGMNLPTPAFLGLNSLLGEATNNRRGYVAAYQITDGHLIISTLKLETASYPSIKGVEAQQDPNSQSGRIYHLNLPSPFTGGMLIGKKGVLGLHLPYGYQRPVNFQTVLELFFINGSLKHVYDRSELAAEIRTRFAEFNSSKPDGKAATTFNDDLEREFTAACGYQYEDLRHVIEK